MKNFFKSMKVLLRAMPHFLLFEALYKLLLVALAAPVSTLLLKLTMKASGVGYLNGESMGIYIHSPMTMIFVLIMLFVSAFFSFVELTALAACFSCYGKHDKITVGGMFLTGVKGFVKAFRGVGILRFLLFMLFMPMAQFTLSSGMFLAPLMPILRRVFVGSGSARAVAVYICIQFLFIWLIIGKSYSLHYLILTDRNFSDCARKSTEKIRRKKIKMTAAYLLWAVFMLVVSAAATFGISYVLILAIKGFTSPGKAFRSALGVLTYATKVFTAISAFFSAPAIMCWLTGRFYADVDKDEKMTLPDRERQKMKKLPKAALIIGLAAAGFFLNFSYIRAVYRGNIRLNVAGLTDTQVSAHRGFSWAAPENTDYAFMEAVKADADYIELDVQMTADGEVVVFHDSELERLSNGSGKLSDRTYSELRALNAAGKFRNDPDYGDAWIMLLSEVLEKYGSEIMFNIEIKDVGNVSETARKTVDIIKKYGIEDTCYVTSFSYTALKTVKEIAPHIKTAIITHLAALSSYSKLSAVDAVSMNYLFVNQSVVNTVHSNGKQIFVWTVDNTDDMQQMIAMGVDNIITNRPDRAVELVYSNKLSDTVLTILESIFSP